MRYLPNFMETSDTPGLTPEPPASPENRCGEIHQEDGVSCHRPKAHDSYHKGISTSGGCYGTGYSISWYADSPAHA